MTKKQDSCSEAPSSMPAKEESWLVRNRARIAMINMMLGNFICAHMFSLQAPFFPKEAELKGATATQYGFVFGVFELVIFIVSPFTAKMVHVGTPKFRLASGMFILGFCCILFGVINYSPPGTPFLALAFAIRIVEGVGAAIYVTTSFTIIAEIFSDRVGTSFAILGSCFGIGLIFGPTIGGALYTAGGYTLPFAVMGSLMVIYSFPTYVFIPEMVSDSKLKSVSFKETLVFWGHYYTLVPVLCSVTNFMVIGFNAALLEPHIRQFNLSPSIIGLMFAISGGVFGLTAPLWGYICDKWISPKPMVFIGTLICTVYCLLVGPVPFLPLDTELTFVIVALVLFGIGSGLKYICAFSALGEDTRKRGYAENIGTSGLVSSVFATSQALGNVIGPSLGGYLFDTIGYRKASTVYLALELTAVCVTFVYTMHEKTFFRRKVRKTKDVDIEEKSPLLDQQPQVICKVDNSLDNKK